MRESEVPSISILAEKTAYVTFFGQLGGDCFGVEGTQRQEVQYSRLTSPTGGDSTFVMFPG